MNPTIFREYDIRGIADDDFTEADVEILGRAIGTLLARHGCRRLTVGRDCRLSSDRYAERLVAGLVATGAEGTDIGVCPTPLLYFSIAHLEQDGGVMITASHNPGEYNGFKICHGLDSVHGEELQQVRAIAEKGDFVVGDGSRRAMDLAPAYTTFLTGNLELARPMRIAVDAGNGTAGPLAVPILTALGCEVVSLYCEMDGRFPNHPADPTVAANLADLMRTVVNRGLDLGIGFDGDGDRIGVVDEQGRIIYGDRLMILFAREILSRKPGATFISEVKCSKAMYDDIEKHGGRAVMWKTGHALLKKKMKEEKAELAGEMSGHMFFADRYFGFDDAIYAAGRLLEILSATERRIAELLADVPATVTTPEIRVDCPDHIKFAVVARVTETLRQSHPVIDIDGVRVLFHDGWGLVRASNTQPALVLRFEALTEDRLADIRDIVEGVLGQVRSEFV
ncbi:MAG: phosphomannomutase/phosphoglucomutase [Desulfobacteraceae bacterium]|jgi:phosphomannomutase/phosphoglucomutase|nr:phosphomannomutase/phosphoglucomutase [Desulfobacteraceae bacterium]